MISSLLMFSMIKVKGKYQSHDQTGSRSFETKPKVEVVMCIYKTSCNLLKPIVQRIFRQHIAISTNCINMAAVSDTNLQGTKNLQPQPFKYFLVLDFEATCENGRTIVPQVFFISLTCIKKDGTCVSLSISMMMMGASGRYHTDVVVGVSVVFALN